MPPKAKISREDILKSALKLVRQNGTELPSARAIAADLGCSTQPIFSNFSSMEELGEKTYETAYRLYLDSLAREAERGEYPQYKAFGMAYIHFAKEERELFRFLFMCDRKENKIKTAPDFEKSVQIIMEKNLLSRKAAEQMHLEIWVCVHGIATMLATNFLNLETELISTMLTDIYQGIRTKYLQDKEKQ